MRTLATLAAIGAIALGGYGAFAVTPSQTSTDAYASMEAMSYVLGSKRAIGFFERISGTCQVTIMIAEAIDPEVMAPMTAAKLRLSMMPGQGADLRSVEGESIAVTCGPDAETIRVKRASIPRF